MKMRRWMIGVAGLVLVCAGVAVFQNLRTTNTTYNQRPGNKPSVAIPPQAKFAEMLQTALGPRAASKPAVAVSPPTLRQGITGFKPGLKTMSPQAVGPNPVSQSAAAPATATLEEKAQQGMAAFRQAKAQADASALLTAAQKESFARLTQSVGGDVDLRIRPEAGTPRFLRGDKLYRAPRNSGLPQEAQAQVTAQAFLAENKPLLRLDDPQQELRLVRQETDALGWTHLRYTQAYRGLEVWPADVIVHLDPAGDAAVFNGFYVPTPNAVEIQPELTADQAIALARNSVPGSANATANVPVTVIHAYGGKASRLAWKLELNVALDAHWLVLIDALNGATLTAYNQVMSANVVGSGADLFGQTRSLNVWQQGSTYYLTDTSKPMYVPTSNPPNDVKGGIILGDLNHQAVSTNSVFYPVTSTSPTSGWLADGVSAMYGLSKTYDYYLAHHGRNSIDGQGGTILAAVRASQGWQNACWNGFMMLFGDGKPYARAIDVVAHELAHGVTQYTSDLVYQDQPGAVNEAMSDCFGENVEVYASGTTDWLHGKDLGQPSRSLSDPSSILIFGQRPYPSKMSEFISSTDPFLDQVTEPKRDNGGVHINSSSINHAYYYLTACCPKDDFPSRSCRP